MALEPIAIEKAKLLLAPLPIAKAPTPLALAGVGAIPPGSVPMAPGMLVISAFASWGSRASPTSTPSVPSWPITAQLANRVCADRLQRLLRLLLRFVPPRRKPPVFKTETRRKNTEVQFKAFTTLMSFLRNNLKYQLRLTWTGTIGIISIIDLPKVL